VSTGDRTAADRERDRAERARRRATRTAAGESPVEVPLPPPASSSPVASATQTADALPQARRGYRLPLAKALVAIALLLVAGAIAVGVYELVKSSKPAPKPIAAPVVARVLIPEGETRVQIVARAHAAGLTGSYLAASKSSPVLDPAHYGAPTGTPNLEGFLFPATYEIYRGESVNRLVREQLVTFKERFGAQDIRRAHELHITPYQLLIIASMVEREAQLPGDRPKVAAVLYNRLHANMPLGIDATIRYALNDYTHPLTAAQLQIDSPYNTRTHTGLPPTPISNPGSAAIEAAAHPVHASYLYYVAGADGCGELVFSTSYAQFERDAKAYREAVSANGGNVPTCHKKG
jgi:cell division protein YceG involved in septum cleavage